MLNPRNIQQFEVTLPDPTQLDSPARGSLKTEDEWLTTDEAAAYLKLSRGVLLNMTSDGRIPYYKLGRSNRYRRDELRGLLLAEPKGVR